MWGTLTGTIIPGQSGAGSDGNEEVLYSSYISRTGASLPVSYPRHSFLRMSYSSEGDTVSVLEYTDCIPLLEAPAAEQTIEGQMVQ